MGFKERAAGCWPAKRKIRDSPCPASTGHHTEGPVKPNKEGAYCKAVVALLSSDPRWEADTQGAESPQPLPTPVAQLPNVRL